MRFIKNINSKIALLVVIVFTFGFTLSDADYFFKVNKSIDIFGRVYKELTLNYVDEIDPEVFMEAGIDGMLKSLDPYTNFISSSEASDMDLITTGKYGGIGISIGKLATRYWMSMENL
jgi:carboxyl-terminal processing protease